MRKGQKLWFGFADWLEKLSQKMKDAGCIRAQEDFLDSYGLVDGRENPHAVTKYNYYQGVNVLLLERLIESGWLKKEEHILDVGCGAGLFVFYMASKGYQYVYGQELDRKLVRLAEDNKKSFLSHAKNYKGQIVFNCGNALELGIPEDITAAYLFNPFYDQATYEEWFVRLKESLEKRPRDFTLVILYPTPSSLSALAPLHWLREMERFSTNTYVCSMCVHFRIYQVKKDLFLRKTEMGGE